MSKNSTFDGYDVPFLITNRWFKNNPFRWLSDGSDPSVIIVNGLLRNTKLIFSAKIFKLSALMFSHI